jgi:hypothetical protein
MFSILWIPDFHVIKKRVLMIWEDYLAPLEHLVELLCHAGDVITSNIE